MSIVRPTPIERAVPRAKYFLMVFGVFTPLILIGWIVQGPVAVSDSTVFRLDLLTFVYPIGAGLTGANIGLLEPFAERGTLQAVVAGVLAVLPWFAGITATMDNGFAHWTRVHTLAFAFTSLILGAALGYGIRRR